MIPIAAAAGSGDVYVDGDVSCVATVTSGDGDISDCLIEFFACIEDGKSAIRWVREHASELGIDPNRLAAGGGSAGGHVAATTGVLKGLDNPAEDASVSSRPRALVLFNPVIDTTEKG
ncbi:MAG: hypothetical protein CL885_03730, partial [Dehalococcoidia bacterium]|nr:hypothetical protein [Dehalococcoidia bacterium]